MLPTLPRQKDTGCVWSANDLQASAKSEGEARGRGPNPPGLTISLLPAHSQPKQAPLVTLRTRANGHRSSCKYQTYMSNMATQAGKGRANIPTSEINFSPAGLFCLKDLMRLTRISKRFQNYHL